MRIMGNESYLLSAVPSTLVIVTGISISASPSLTIQRNGDNSLEVPSVMVTLLELKERLIADWAGEAKVHNS